MLPGSQKKVIPIKRPLKTDFFFLNLAKRAGTKEGRDFIYRVRGQKKGGGRRKKVAYRSEKKGGGEGRAAPPQTPKKDGKKNHHQTAAAAGLILPFKLCHLGAKDNKTVTPAVAMAMAKVNFNPAM